MKKVVVGVEDRDIVQLSDGVKPGEQIVTVGQHELQEGAKVKPAAGEEAKSDKPESGAKAP